MDNIHTTEELKLEIERYTVVSMLNELCLEDINVDESQLSVMLDHHIASMAYTLAVSLRLPGTKIGKLCVASYPTTWWDHFKARWGWRHNITKVWREDTALFPDLKLPDNLMKNVRVYTSYNPTWEESDGQDSSTEE